MLNSLEAQKILNQKIKTASIQLISEYEGDKKIHEFKCTICNHYWSTTPNQLKRKDNIGCPKCNILKNEKKKFEKEYFGVLGTKKLLTNITLPMRSNWLSNDIEDLIKIKKNKIKDFQALIPIIEKELYILEDNLKETKLKNKAIYDSTLKFGIFAVILFPIWLWYQLKQSAKRSPLFKSINTLEDKIKRKNFEIYHEIPLQIQKLENEIRKMQNDAEYQANISRLENRLNINIGGKTNLYYFRFAQNGQKYYKIGISINGLEARYRNKDGSLYKRIEKVFFDLPLREAIRFEKLILHTFASHKANDSSLLRSKGGYTEVFKIDVLELDTY